MNLQIQVMKPLIVIVKHPFLACAIGMRTLFSAKVTRTVRQCAYPPLHQWDLQSVILDLRSNPATTIGFSNVDDLNLFKNKEQRHRKAVSCVS